MSSCPWVSRHINLCLNWLILTLTKLQEHRQQNSYFKAKVRITFWRSYIKVWLLRLNEMLASLTLIRLNNVNKCPCMYSNHKEHSKLGPHVVRPSDLSFFFHLRIRIYSSRRRGGSQPGYKNLLRCFTENYFKLLFLTQKVLVFKISFHFTSLGEVA